MNYEQLEKANQTIKTTDIKGKAYAEVNQRIKVFRMLYPEGCIETEIKNIEGGVVLMEALVRDGEGKLLATGHAYEKESSSYINRTSYIENCETSAVGRALGMLGIGIDTSIASKEEVENAIHQQETMKTISEKNILQLQAVLKNHKMPESEFLKRYKKKNLRELTVADWADFGKHGEDFLKKWDEQNGI